MIAGSSNRARKRTVKTGLFFPFDLNHFGVMNDDFDGPEPNPFQCEQDRLFDCTVRRWIRYILIQSEHVFDPLIACSINLYIIDHN